MRCSLNPRSCSTPATPFRERQSSRRSAGVQGGRQTSLTTGAIPSRFEKSQTVGAIFGLTPRIYASGEVEQRGRITKCGDGSVRWLLYEAANSVLTRCKSQNWLRDWALNVARRRGMRKARIALARRLAVVMHRMWVNHAPFSALRPA